MAISRSNIVLLVVFQVWLVTYCDAAGSGPKKDINLNPEIGTPIIPPNISSTVTPPTPVTPNTTTTTPTPITPNTTTTSPPTPVTPNTTTITPPTPVTPNTTTVIPTTPVTPNTTTPLPPTTPSTTTVPPKPTPKPVPDRKFDGPSFIGGMILTMGLMAIAFVSWKFYKARTERNYHTL